MESREKMPLKRILALGKQIFVSQPVRLAISILLLITVTVLYGIMFTAFCINEYDTELTLLYDEGWHTVYIHPDNLRFGHGGFFYVRLMDDQLETVTEYNDGKEMITHFPGLISSEERKWPFDYIAYADDFVTDNVCYYKVYNGDVRNGNSPRDPRVAGISSETGCEDLDLRPDDRFLNDESCRLPQTFDEIAITDLHASLFMRYGYKESDGTAVEVRTPDDLIGKQLGEFTICGVYSTEMDREYFEQYSDATIEELYEKDRYNARIIDKSDTSIIHFMFIKEGYEIYYAIKHGLDVNKQNILNASNFIKLSGDKSKDLKLFADLNYINSNGQRNSAKIGSPFHVFIEPLYFFRDYKVQIPYQIGSGLVAIVALILMSGYFKRIFYEADDLCPPGMRRKDILLVCLIAIGMFVGIGFIISLFAVIAMCGIINAISMIPLFGITFASIALTFAVCIGMVTLITVFKVCELLRGRKADA